MILINLLYICGTLILIVGSGLKFSNELDLCQVHWGVILSWVINRRNFIYEWSYVVLVYIFSIFLWGHVVEVFLLNNRHFEIMCLYCNRFLIVIIKFFNNKPSLILFVLCGERSFGNLLYAQSSGVCLNCTVILKRRILKHLDFSLFFPFCDALLNRIFLHDYVIF